MVIGGALMECRGWRSAAERYERERKRERCVTSEMWRAVTALNDFFASDDWQAASWLLRVSGKPPVRIAREKVWLPNGCAEVQYVLDSGGIQCFVGFGGASYRCSAPMEDVVCAWAFSWGGSASGFMPWLYAEIDIVRDEAPDLAGQWAWR